MDEKRKVLRLNESAEWKEILFVDIKAGDKIRLLEPTGELVEHQDGRTSYTATSDAYINELGQMCFEITDELTES